MQVAAPRSLYSGVEASPVAGAACMAVVCGASAAMAGFAVTNVTALSKATRANPLIRFLTDIRLHPLLESQWRLFLYVF